MSLKQKAISGLFWTMGEQFGSQIINFLVQIVLARLLSPSDFGAIAMIMVFISIGNSLSDSGLTSSLIRTTNANNTDYSTVFFFNLIGSIVIYLTIFILSPFFARFYNNPDLTAIIRALSLSIVINAFAGVQLTKMKKELLFKKIMLINIPSIVIAGIVGVYLAYKGAGVWSLVALTLAQSTISTAQIWIKSNWFPSITIDRDKLKKHFRFGYKLTVASLLDSIFVNIYNIVIGKWFSAKDLGYYNRADIMQGFPLRNLILAIKKVAYPLLSTIQHNDAALRNAYKKIMQLVAFWITPLMILAIIIAKPLIELVLTSKWLPAVPYFQLLCVSSILYPLQEYNLQILDVKGRSDIYLRIQLIKKGIIVIAICISVFYGIMGLLYMQIVLSVLFYYISSYIGGKVINFSMREQLLGIYPIFVIAFCSGAIAWFFNNYILSTLEFSNVINILANSALFGILYFGSSYLLKIPIFRETALILKQYRR